MSVFLALRETAKLQTALPGNLQQINDSNTFPHDTVFYFSFMIYLMADCLHERFESDKTLPFFKYMIPPTLNPS